MSLPDNTTTAEDARNRVLMARMGSLAGEPTLAYLYALRRHVTDWLTAIDVSVAAAEQAPLVSDELVKAA